MQADKKEPISIVYNKDCVQGMKKYPDKHFSLSVVDPPYGINAGWGIGRAARKKIASGEIKGGHWDDKTPTLEYFEELFRVSKNQIIWGGNYFKLPTSKCFLIWDKGESIYNRDFAECEMAWASFDKCARIFKKNPNQNNRIHPTQKPVALYDWILSRYANPGDLILDTHLGSGSSRIAAHKAGLDFIGFELDTDYFNAQEERFKLFKSQLRLF